MPYIKSTVTAGKVKDVTHYHTIKYNSPKRPRSKNKNKTSDLQAKTNERNSHKNLFHEISANFQADDLYLTCTYGTEREEPTPPEAKDFFEKCINKIRYRYKKAGTALKYIGITEHHKRRIHHHILINNIGLSVKNIKKCWQHGFMKIQIFMGEPEDCERIANYFIKESNNTFNTDDKVHGLRWISSRNLIHPVPEKKIVHASTWKEDPKPIKGYYIAFVKRGQTQSGYYYLHYRMIKIEEESNEMHTRTNNKRLLPKMQL